MIGQGSAPAPRWCLRLSDLGNWRSRSTNHLGDRIGGKFVDQSAEPVMVDELSRWLVPNELWALCASALTGTQMRTSVVMVNQDGESIEDAVQAEVVGVIGVVRTAVFGCLLRYPRGWRVGSCARRGPTTDPHAATAGTARFT